MRILLAAIALAFVIPAAAQSAARSRPPGTVPLEEPPPLPPMGEAEATQIAPVITTRTEGGAEIQEYRVRGKLYMMRVKPKDGPAYVMMDHKGDGTFMKQDNTLDSGIRVPQWVLMEF